MDDPVREPVGLPWEGQATPARRATLTRILVRIAREIVTRTIDREQFLQQAAGFMRERPEITNLVWINAGGHAGR